jgi:hypothetical protein
MIHLFRKIRQKLIAENQLKKYILYAFGEILLVMIGILLALQFSTWNQEKENSEKEEWYLISIVEDLEYQKSILKEMRVFCNKNIKTGSSILKQYYQEKSFVKVDSLDENLNSLMNTFIYPNINNTYTELVSSGKYDLIEDKTLSTEIIGYFSYINEQHVNIKTEIDNVFYPEVYPAYNKFSQLELPSNISGLDESFFMEKDNELKEYIHSLLEKPASKLLLINAIKTQISLLDDNLKVIEETLKYIKEITQFVDDYLGLTPEMVNHYD